MTGVRSKRRNLIRIIAIVVVLTLILTSCDSEDNSSQGKKTLTVFTMDKLVFEPIMEFTNYNPHWRIEIEEGLDDPDNASDGIKKLNAELFSGKGPDIIIMDELNADKYIEAGLLEDITDIVEDADGVSKKIIDNQRVDGAIYTMPMGFNLILDTASPDLNISFKDFTSFIDSLNQKKCRLDTWYPNMAGIWYRTELADKIYADEKIHVNKLKGFYKNLASLHEYTGNDPYNIYFWYENFRAISLSTLQYFDASRYVFDGENETEINVARDYIGNIVDLQLAYQFQRDGLLELSIFKDSSGYRYVPRYILAVNKNAENKDAALECIKYMLQDGQEYMMSALMFPVNIDILTDTIIESSDTRLNMKKLECITDEEKREIIYSVSNLGNDIKTDIYAMEIVMKGSEEFLSGNADISTACEKTMNKLNIYYAEG